jgi:UDP-3-O-[3-hydroxymyristoyl] glucosamine N-acyltransferase
MTVRELIAQLGGELIQGDPETQLLGVGDVNAALGLDLVFAEKFASLELALSSRATAVVTSYGTLLPTEGTKAVIFTEQPRLWFARAARLLQEPPHVTGVHPTAAVAKDAILSQGTSVGACAVIGHGASIGPWTRVDAGAVIGDQVHIGEHCHIYPRVVIYSGTELWDRVIVHAGAVLGADGFGYVHDRFTGEYTQFPQQGTLVIEDDVEIGANSTIDRGALTETRIRRGTKIDNLVHIGHNCDIGENVVMASLTGISGSSTIGNGAVLAGQVGVGDHAHIGPGVVLGGQAGVLSGKTVTTTGTVLWGTPAKPLKEYLRELATLARLSRRDKD